MIFNEKWLNLSYYNTVSIVGSGDIVGGNKKLILGLIWTLILHYQINLGLGLNDKSKNKKMSAKKALLEYINVRVISQLSIIFDFIYEHQNFLLVGITFVCVYICYSNYR